MSCLAWSRPLCHMSCWASAELVWGWRRLCWHCGRMSGPGVGWAGTGAVCLARPRPGWVGAGPTCPAWVGAVAACPAWCPAELELGWVVAVAACPADPELADEGMLVWPSCRKCFFFWDPFWDPALHAWHQPVCPYFPSNQKHQTEPDPTANKHFTSNAPLLGCISGGGWGFCLRLGCFGDGGAGGGAGGAGFLLGSTLAGGFAAFAALGGGFG